MHFPVVRGFDFRMCRDGHFILSRCGMSGNKESKCLLFCSIAPDFFCLFLARVRARAQHHRRTVVNTQSGGRAGAAAFLRSKEL